MREASDLLSSTFITKEESFERCVGGWEMSEFPAEATYAFKPSRSSKPLLFERLLPLWCALK